MNNVAQLPFPFSCLIGIGIPLDAVAGIIVACGTVHTFLNFIPSALVGAPDDNMAPVHTAIGCIWTGCAGRRILCKRVTKWAY